VPSPLFKPPKHLVKEWPEVFEDMYMNTMPVAYLDVVRLEFVDGRVWEINVKSQLEDNDADIIAEKLLATLSEFKDDIKKLDFKVNIEKLKLDVGKSTKDIF